MPNPKDVLEDAKRLEVTCFVATPPVATAVRLELSLLDGEQVVAQTRLEQRLDGSPTPVTLTLEGLTGLELWDLDHPKRYTVVVSLYQGERCLDRVTTHIGFRQAEFTPGGFVLNGRPLKLRGLNRHQTYPFVGQAMPARVQRQDALILKHELKCNIVRTSHYPQSPHFLDACDEIGLLVFEEIPGWQHIGDEGWKALACRDVEAMVRRDWNRPAIILWGVRINESKDDHDFYQRTNAIAHALDDTRQTGGVRVMAGSELLEDVYTVNDCWREPVCLGGWGRRGLGQGAGASGADYPQRQASGAGWATPGDSGA